MKKTIIFFFIATTLVTIILLVWFSEGKFIANGSEENFNIFHSQKSAQYASSFWRSGGTGYKTSFLISTYPTFSILGWMEKMGMPAFIRQALLLSTLMILGMLSMYLLIKYGMNLENNVAVVGGIFYCLNIYTMTQIWKRFIYSHMFAWAYLPLFIYLWIKWISTKNFLWLFIFVVSSLFFSFAFSNPVFLLTIWTSAFVFVLVKLWSERKEIKKPIRTITYSLVGLFLWLIINIWWFIPTLTLGSTWTTQSGQTWEGDLSSLHAVSKYFPIWEIMLLRQSWYLGHENDWFDFYHNPFVYLISLIILFIAIQGFLKIKSFPYGKYLTVLAIVGLFISKGTSFPFGYTFFEILFSKFSLTVALRNSYEKFGIIWLLPYTVFFAIGFNGLFASFKKRQRYILKGVIILLSCGLLVLPIWNGDIFPEKQRFNIPDYYIEANNYLKSLPVVDNRIFTIPSSIELGRLTYSWGFYGVDPSDNLFEMEVLSIPKVSGFYPFYEILQKHLYERDTDKLLGLLGVENIILHKDDVGSKIDVSGIQNKIEKWESIKSKKDFDQLTVYSLDKGIVKPRVYAATSIKLVSSIEDGVKDILSGSLDTNDTIFFTEDSGIIPAVQNSTKPKIELDKHSLSWYTVDVKNAKGPFVLILNNTFDRSWQLTINNELIESHFIANGFLNGWVVDKDGDYTIEIKLVVWPALPF